MINLGERFHRLKVERAYLLGIGIFSIFFVLK